MLGGSRPNRALTIRATCPAGTIGTVGTMMEVDGAGAAGADGGGTATGWAAGGPSCSGLGLAGGVSTPEDAPGGTRFWLGPIEPGGRGGELSNPGGRNCASAGEAAIATAIATAVTATTANRRRPVRRKAGREALMTQRFTAGNRANSSLRAGLSSLWRHGTRSYVSGAVHA